MIGWNALALLAAVTLAPPPELPAPPPAEAIPTPEQVMAIPPEARAFLHERVMAPGKSQERRLQRLMELVFQPSGIDLQYDTEATLTVAETWRQRRANCLSFALMFVALAREMGLQARMQEVGQVVIWYEEQGLMFNAGHVNVGMSVNGRPATLDLDQNVLYDRSGPQPISDQRALAHFYNNRGAEELARHDYAMARQYFEAALRMDPRFAATWSNLGVLDARENNDAGAISDFDEALAINRNHAAALHNASQLYQRLGQTAQADQLRTRLEHNRRRDPFYHFLQGAAAERATNYTRAIDHYRKAIRLYPSAHQFHFGLARAYYLNGQNHRAEREMERARALGSNDQTRALYQAKLESLRRLGAAHAAH